MTRIPETFSAASSQAAERLGGALRYAAPLRGLLSALWSESDRIPRAFYPELTAPAVPAIRKEAEGWKVRLAGRSEEEAARFLFCLQSVYCLCVTALAASALEPRALEEDCDSLLPKLASGSFFRDRGIRNFPDTPRCFWYQALDSEPIHKALRDSQQCLQTITQSELDLSACDLGRDLYEVFFPPRVRRGLGEFYTPAPLAGYALDRLGFKPGMTLLDPTCGAGTFLLAAYQRELAAGPDRLEEAMGRIWGIDINPLAVLSAKANLISRLMAGRSGGGADILLPILCTDCLLPPEQGSDGSLVGRIDGTCGPVSASWSGSPTQASPAPHSLLCVPEDVANAIRAQLEHYPMGPEEREDLVLRLRDTVLSAQLPPIEALVGNPPWVRWSGLPDAYQERVRPVCQRLGLQSGDAFVGALETDISAVVIYASVERWLAPGGSVSMVVNRSLFKTRYAARFRRFVLLDSGRTLRVTGSEDFSALRLFEGAANNPVLLHLQADGEPTHYPVPWRKWTLERSSGQARPVYEEQLAEPADRFMGPWLTADPDTLRTCRTLMQGERQAGPANRARKGVCTDLNGAYFGTLKAGRFRTEFMPDPAGLPVERALLHPVVRGREISPFRCDWAGEYVLLPQEGMHGYPESEMQAQFPAAYRYLAGHRERLRERSSLRRCLPNDPFYTCWNVGPYTFAPYKVCWREITSRMASCVLTELDGQTAVPDHKVYFVPLESEEEAHYLCAVLNSGPAALLVSSLMEQTSIGGQLLSHLRIPRYDGGNPIHKALANLSMQAHSLCREAPRQGREEALAALSTELDGLMRSLFLKTESC